MLRDIVTNDAMWARVTRVKDVTEVRENCCCIIAARSSGVISSPATSEMAVTTALMSDDLVPVP